MDPMITLSIGSKEWSAEESAQHVGRADKNAGEIGAQPPQDIADISCSCHEPLKKVHEGHAGVANTPAPDRAAGAQHIARNIANSMVPSAAGVTSSTASETGGSSGLQQAVSPPAPQKAQDISLDDAADLLSSNCREPVKAWDFETKFFIESSPCVGSDGTVYVGSNDGNVYAVKDGQKCWNFNIGGKLESSPCVGSDGTVYIGGKNNVYALKDGKMLWDYKTDGNVRSSPCIGPMMERSMWEVMTVRRMR